MNKSKPYLYIEFVGGLCALVGGALGIAIGLRDDTQFLILGFISLATGIVLFYNMSKK